MRISVAICAIFYLLLSLGLKVNAHYCGGKLQSISFADIQEDCNTCGQKSMKGCCSDVETALDVSESDSIKTYRFVTNFSFAVAEPLFFAFESTYDKNQSSVGTESIHAPPNDPSKPIYLKNCIFII